jgi:hypothetical protein
MQAGALAICIEAYATGFCKTARKFAFTIDTTSNEATIDAQ